MARMRISMESSALTRDKIKSFITVYLFSALRKTKLFFLTARSSSARVRFVANSYSACISNLPSDVLVPYGPSLP